MNTFSSIAGQRTGVTSTLYTQSCCNCQILFAVPEDFARRRREDHANFFCPAGHSQRYTEKSEAEKLREEIEARNRRIEYRDTLIAGLEKDKQSLKFKAMAERGHKVRLQRRIAAGVCPCCTRSFSNLTKHMAHMHPEFTPEAP